MTFNIALDDVVLCLNFHFVSLTQSKGNDFPAFILKTTDGNFVLKEPEREARGESERKLRFQRLLTYLCYNKTDSISILIPGCVFSFGRFYSV